MYTFLIQVVNSAAKTFYMSAGTVSILQNNEYFIHIIHCVQLVTVVCLCVSFLYFCVIVILIKTLKRLNTDEAK